MGSVDDIHQLCRLCLVKDQVNQSIFDETSDIGQISVKINSCLPVKVSREDNLPKKICDGCSYKLDMLYIFRNTSVESEKQLISWLSQAGLSTIPSQSKDPLANTTKPETTVTVKQETFDVSERLEGENHEDVADSSNYLMQQSQLPYQEGFEFAEASGSAELTEEPPPKRAKRAAALKRAPIDETDEADVDDDLDSAMQITKAEEEDSDDMDQPDYVEPSTSADDQPGPSGVGKAAEAPLLSSIKEEWIEITEPMIMCSSAVDNNCAGNVGTHEKSVTKETSYKCETCNSYFALPKHLKRHLRLHANQNRIKCKICGRRFSETRKFKAHQITHTGEKPFKCDICDKSYSDKSNLFRHKRVYHTAQTPSKPFECDTCNKTFSYKSCLKQHLRIHTGEKPYCCFFCGKLFADLGNYRRHKLVHPDEEPLKC